MKKNVRPQKMYFMALFCFCLILTNAFLANAQAPDIQPIKVGPVEVSGSFRTRYENWAWFDVPNKDSKYDYVGSIFRLSLKGKHSFGEQSLDWQVEGAFPSFGGLPRGAVAAAPQGILGLGGNYAAASGDERVGFFLKQLFLRWKFTKGSYTTALRAGRFEYSDGLELQSPNPTVNTLKRQRIAERLLGPFGFTHVGRSFDGVHFNTGTAQTSLTLLAARPTVGVFQVEGAGNLEDVNFFYTSFNRALHPTTVSGGQKQFQGEARLFALYYRDSRQVLKVDNRPLAARVADRDPISITTIGGNYLRAIKAGKGTADVLVWGAFQVGSFGRLDQRAGSIAVEGGYQPNLALKPWFRAGYFRSTGDGDPTDNTQNTFFQILPTPRIYARMPFFNLMNNQDVFVQTILRPSKKLNLRADLHNLRLSNSKDLWYLGGGAFQRETFGFVGRPSNGKKSLANLLDLSVDYQFSPHIGLSFYYAQIFGGDVIKRIYPTGKNGHLGYAEFTYKF
ncbi:MAG: alginate export family protein [Blastocatellia bacterium]|nr:alginate export family protein [Blastocatellia bacterium]